MKRGPGPQRNPAKTRAWQDRSRKPLKRTELRSTGRRHRPPEGPLDPATWAIRVAQASGLRSIVTPSARAAHAFDPRFHAHHPLPKGELRARRLYAYVYDERNGVLVTKREHERHELAVARIPGEALPTSVWEFAAKMDALEGTQWATEKVRRLHPSDPGGH